MLNPKLDANCLSSRINVARTSSGSNKQFSIAYLIPLESTKTRSVCNHAAVKVARAQTSRKHMENNNKQIYNYTVLLEKESDGGYHAFCPILKGCHSQGDSVEEALENITEAIELYLESLRADNLPIPREDLIVKPLSILA